MSAPRIESKDFTQNVPFLKLDQHMYETVIKQCNMP